MKAKYLGTNVDPADHRTFGIRAAQKGISKAALLKELVMNFVSEPALAVISTRRQPSKVAVRPKPRRKPRAKKEVATA